MAEITSNHHSKISLEQDSLSFRWAAISILVVSIVIAILIAIFAGLDTLRQMQIVTQYTHVADQFVSQNHGQVESLFNRTFDDCATELQQKIDNPMLKNIENMGQNFAYSCDHAKQVFNQLNKNALPDFPSTAYLRVQGQNVELLEASGDYFKPQALTHLYQLYHDDDLQSYLFQSGKIRQWNTFLTYMQQRQVILPIRQNDQTIGYMFIGVIEK